MLFVETFARQHVARHEVEVTEYPAEFEHSPAIDAILEIGDRTRDRASRNQMRRRLRGCVVLHQPQVRLADRPDLAVRPGQARSPFYRVVAIRRLLDERRELPFRAESSARVLHHQHVTAGWKVI